MLVENDNLKDEVESLKQALEAAQATIGDLKQNLPQDSKGRNNFEALQRENRRLTAELADAIEARDEAMK